VAPLCYPADLVAVTAPDRGLGQFRRQPAVMMI